MAGNASFNGKVHSYQPTSYTSEIKQYLNSSYPIRMQGQCLNSSNVSTLRSAVDGHMSLLKNALDNFIDLCEEAKTYSGLDAFHASEEDGYELNHIPEDLDRLISTAKSINDSLPLLRDGIMSFANDAVTKDNQEYNRWKAYEETQKAQELKSKTTGSKPGSNFSYQQI